MGAQGLRIGTSSALREKRLAALLAGREDQSFALEQDVEDAQVLGSLQLAGFDTSWEVVKAARRGEPVPAPVAGLHRALRAVAPVSAFDRTALLAWKAALTGGEGSWRRAERRRDDGPQPAPVEFVEGRVRILVDWLAVESSRELTPAARGALVLARLIEIAPFDEANGRVARLAASHVMARAGSRRPILVGGDRPRLEACLQAAFRFETEPLAALLDEAAGRCLDVMIQSLETGGTR